MSERENAVVWHWLRPDRQQAEGTFEELTGLLSARALPRSTMVWMDPWPEWRPAHRVPELAPFVPPSPARDKPVEVAGEGSMPGREDARRPLSEPPPAGSLPKIPRPGPPRPTGRATLNEAAKGIALRVTKPGLGEPARTALATTAAEEERSPGPPVTAELPAPLATALAPAAIEPVAPVEGSTANELRESSPSPAKDSVPPAETLAAVLAANHISVPPPAALPAPTVASPPVVAESPEHGLGERMASEAPRERADASPRAEWAATSEAPRVPTFGDRRAAVTSEAPVELALEPGPRSPEPSRHLRIALIGSASACVLLTVALAASLKSLAAARAEAKAPVAAAPQVTKPAVLPGCTLLTPPARLAESIEREVLPSLAAVDSDHIAIGFAGARTEARGIVVSLTTLDAKPTFVEAGERAVVGVAANGGDERAFKVQREDSAASTASTLDPAEGTVIGATREAIVRQRGDEPAVALWPLPNSAVTVPRVARLGPRGGYAVALREGGASGHLGFGWLDATGAPNGDFQRIDAGVRLLGSPALATSDHEVLLAFAGRDDESAPWRLRLGRASAGSSVAKVSDFALGPEDLGAGAIAPSLVAFGEKRWILQWTQGEPGRLRVRVQQLGESLAPIAAPLAVSPMGANAGQGSVWAFADRVVSLFLLPVPGRDELWGSVLRCQ